MKKLLITLIFISFILGCSVSSVSGIEDYAPLKQGECITLKQTCASCSYLNFSVIYPNSSIAISEAEGVSSGGALWTYEFCNTETLGRYDVVGHGDLDGTDTGFSSLYFYVTPTGVLQTTSQGINSAVFLFLMLGLTGILGFLGFKFLNNDYLWVLGLFFIFLMFIFIIYDVWLGYEFHRTLTGINDGSSIPEILFWMFMFILVSGLITCGILLFKYWKKVKEWFIKAKEDYEYDRQEDERNWR